MPSSDEVSEGVPMAKSKLQVPGARPPAEGDLDTLRHLHNAERANYWDAANLLAKSMAYYLAISAAVLGYVLTQKLDPPLPRLIVFAGLTISTGYIVALSAGVWGLFRQMKLVDALGSALATSAVDPSYLTFQTNWRGAVGVIAACTFLFVGVVIAALVVLLLR
jgi:hypothetical protein